MPTYWQGDGLWGLGDFPVLEPPADSVPIESDPSGLPSTRPEAHLRSAKAVNGYLLRAVDGMLGHICDFMVDPNTWALSQLVVKTGHRFSGKESH